MNQIVIATTFCRNGHKNDVAARHMDADKNCFFGDDYNFCKTCGDANIPGAASFRIEELVTA